MTGIARATMLNRIAVADEGVVQWYPGRRWGTGVDEGVRAKVGYGDARKRRKRGDDGYPRLKEEEEGRRWGTQGCKKEEEEGRRRGTQGCKKEEEEGQRWGTRGCKKEEEEGRRQGTLRKRRKRGDSGVPKAARKRRKRGDEVADAVDHEEAVVEEVPAGDPDAINGDLDVEGVGYKLGAKRDGGGCDGEAAAGAGGLKLGAEGELREVGEREEAGDEMLAEEVERGAGGAGAKEVIGGEGGAGDN